MKKLTLLFASMLALNRCKRQAYQTMPVKYCQRVVILFYFPIKSVQNSSHGTGLE